MSRASRRARRHRLPAAATIALLAAAFGVAVLALPAGNLATLATSLPLQPPGTRHLFGTDDLGRDVLGAVLQGLRTSLVLGAAVTAVTQVLGIAVGLAAGLGARLTDEVLMRTADVVASLPTLLLAILAGALFGGSLTALVVVLGLTRWPVVARLVRAEAASLRHREFVVAARAMGASPLRIAVRHVLPHAATPALAATGIVFGGAVVAEAALAFVGLGDPATTSLGQLAASGFAFVHHAPWMWIAPVVAIVALTFAAAALAERSS